MILNTITAGQPVPETVHYLKEALDNRDGRSLYQYISVHCYSLAKVLDRLEYLENYKKMNEQRMREGLNFSPNKYRESLK